MSKKVVLVIQEDPRKTHRPVEALRIALGLLAGAHETTVVLLGHAVGLLSDDTDEIIDGDVLERYLPSLQQLNMPFLVESATDRSLIRKDFNVRYEDYNALRSHIHTAERTLIF